MSEIPTFDQLVRGELSKYDAVIPRVEELKANYMSLTIESMEDKDGYAKVKEALRHIVSKRNEIEEKRRELKADSLAFGRAVDARAKEITALISPIEEYLKSQKSRIDDEIESIRLKEEMEKQARLRSRHDALVSAGMRLVGNEYIWQGGSDEALPSVNLETMDDFDFQKYADRILALNENKLTEERKRERERIDQQIRLEREREEIAEQQRQLRMEQAKIREEHERMQREVDQMRKIRTDSRISQLHALGLVTSFDHLCYLRDMKSLYVISVDQVTNAANEDWPEVLSGVTKIVERYRNEDDREKREAEEKIRAEEQRREEMRRKEAEAAEAKAEQERLAGLSDKEKVADYCRRLLEIPAPEVGTIKWKKELKVITTTLVTYL